MSVELATAYVSLAVSTKGLGKDIQKQFGDVDGMADKTGRSAGNRLSGAMGKALKIGAASVAAAGIATLGTALVKGFQRLDALDQATAKLRGLGHSAGTVDAIMANALASVKGTAFGMDEAATTAAGAVAAGIKPGKDLERTLTLVADAATIAGTDMSSMGSIVNKVATSDMMQMDVANQLMDAGIPILQMVADTLGVTAEEARKMASAGQISFATFQEALEGGVGGAAQESGKTFQGAMKNVLASLGRIGAGLLSGLFPMVTSGLGSIQDALAPIEDMASRVGESIGKFVQSMVDTFGAIWSVFKDVFGAGTEAEALAGALAAADAAAQPFAGAMTAISDAMSQANMVDRMATLRDILESIKGAFGAAKDAAGGFLSEAGERLAPIIETVVDAFGPVLKSLGEQFGPILKDLLPQIVGVVQNLSPMSLIFQAMQPILPQVVGLIASLVEALGGTLAAILPTVMDLLGTLGKIFSGTIVPIITELVSTLLPVFLEIFTAIMPVLAQIARAILPALAKVFGVIVPVIGTLVKALLPPLAKLFAAVAPLIAAVAQIIGKLVEILVPILIPVIETLVNILSAILIPVFKLVGWVIEKIVVPIIGAVVSAIEWVAGGFSGLGDTVKKVFDFIGKIFLNFTGPGLIIKHWDTIKGAFQSAWDWIKGTFSKLWDGAKDIVSKPIEWARDKISDLIWGIRYAFEDMKNAVPRAFEAMKNAIAKPINWIVDNVINPFLSAIKKLLDAVGLDGLSKKLPLIATAGGALGSAGAAALGYADGGWTGPGSKYQPAGVVHADEFVVSKAARGQFEKRFPGYLSHINMHGTLPGYATGGRVIDAPGKKHSGYSWANWAGDFPAPTGTPVFSWKDGIVALVKHLTTSYGKHVRVNHDDGTSSLYAHLSKILAFVGQRVTQGQTLGLVGSTGNSTGPHLHAEFLGGPFAGAMSGSAQASGFDIGKMLRDAVGGLISKKVTGGGFIGDFLNAIPGKLLDGVISKATSMFGSAAGVGTLAGGVERWRPMVMQALAAVGQSGSLAGTTLRRMNQESGGNPRAINNWDINAKNGTPSKGLMQVIDPTFRAYRDKSLPNDIWDPMANTVASMRYALGRYGSLSRAYNRPGGYLNGGMTKRNELAWLSEDGRPELVVGKQLGALRRNSTVLNADDTAGLMGGRDVEVRVLFDDPRMRHLVRTEVRQMKREGAL